VSWTALPADSGWGVKPFGTLLINISQNLLFVVIFTPVQAKK
jgi:hypothetical protein